MNDEYEIQLYVEVLSLNNVYILYHNFKYILY